MAPPRSKKPRLVTKYPIQRYKCGLIAGDLVRLRVDLVICDHRGRKTGKIHHRGEIWRVLTGSKEKQPIVWLRNDSGERHTWDDNKQSIGVQFEKVRYSEPRTYSLVRFLRCDFDPQYLQKFPFKPGRSYLYLSAIKNMPAHCAVMDCNTGRVYAGYHTSNFLELSEDET